MAYYVDNQGNVHRVISASESVAVVDPSETPKHQANITIIANALTNINGRVLSNYEANQVTISGYTAIRITYGGATLTEEQAKAYMEYMTGSVFLPTYNYQKPQNSIFLMSDYTMWKPQFDSTNGLLLFKMGKLVKQAELDDLQSQVDELKAIIGEVVIESADLTFNDLDFSALPNAVDNKSIVFSAGMDLKEIKGNTVVVNQKLQNGDFSNGTTGWSSASYVSSFTVSNKVATIVTSSGATDNTFILKSHFTVPQGHKLLIHFKAKLSEYVDGSWIYCGAYQNASIFYYRKDLVDTNEKEILDIVTTLNPITNGSFGVGIRNSNGTSVTYTLKDIYCIDLTQWFGSNDAIPSDLLADPSLFTSKYYHGDLSYNEGTIVNSKPTKIITKDTNNNVLGEYPLSCPILRSAGNAQDTDKKVNIGVVDLGSLQWEKVTNELFLASVPNNIKTTTNPREKLNLLTPLYTTDTAQHANSDASVDKVVFVWGDIPTIRIRDLSYSSATDFKTAMSGVMLYFELEIPTDQEAITLPEDIKIQEGGTIEVEYDEDDFTPSDFDFEVAVSRLEV